MLVACLFTSSNFQMPARDDRYFGVDLESLGDLDGDGRAEFVVAAANAGCAVYACSGEDGRVLEGFLPQRGVPSFSWNNLVAGDDYDGDGKPDFVVSLRGERDASDVVGYSPSRRRILFETSLPGNERWQIADLQRVDDLTRDGVPDVLVNGWRGEEYRTHAMLISGRSGQVVEMHDDCLWFDAGDRTGDGVPELFMSWRDEGPNPRVLFDGATRDVIETSIAGKLLGDVDCNGTLDYLAWSLDAVGRHDDWVFEFNAQSEVGITLWKTRRALGWSGTIRCDVTTLSSLRRDGSRDFVLGLSGTLFSEMLRYSGATGEILWRITGPDELGGHGYFGSVVATSPDLNGDGHEDILVGTAAWRVPWVTRIFALCGATGAVLSTTRSEVELARESPVGR